MIDDPCANATNLRLAICNAKLRETRAAATETPGYLSWLRVSLNGRTHPGNQRMVSQILEKIMAASEMLGGILEHKHSVAITKRSPEHTEKATDIGLYIY